jgi:hypothetical protein
MGALLDQAALQISREREASQPRTPLLLLPDLLRNALAAWRWLWRLDAELGRGDRES